MKTSHLSYALGIIILVSTIVYSCTMGDEVTKEDNTPDTELVKCLEQKIINLEIIPESPYGDTELAVILEQSFPSSNEVWVGDSITINIVTTSLYIDREYVDKTSAYVTLIDDRIELTEHESDRLVEITMKQFKKLDKIRESKQKNHQDSLRAELTKYCK